ncbi:response regulator [Sulfurimonas sp. SAG-AH-194-L11]|nr:ATP-binding protein [Sulfurimonas sp. SAG-AH-194-L11]MDF1876729.1 response regulator [Sulfurimonas sp. SAG-AH-194-L11]
MSLKSMFFGSSENLKKLKEERDTYKKKSERLSQELYDVQALLSKEIDSTKKTSFVSGKIQRIEELENELTIQKQRVQDARKIAQEANHVKQDFLANMRHEVRTPMNSIIAFSDMLTQELEDKTHLSYAKNIFSSGNKLLSLMDNIIELSRLESGIFEFKGKAIDTSLYFNTIVKEHEAKAYNKGLLLTLNIDAAIPVSLILDDQKVRAILDNLIDNAIKFTQKGMVKVKVVAQNHNYAQNRVSIAMIVSDSGIGIDADNHKKIFEIFEKNEDNSNTEFQGTGLGLSINKKTAKLMGGDISVSSKLAQGSVFTFKLTGLEIVLRNAQDSIDESPIDFSVVKPEGATVMVIDDVKSSCEVIENSFKNTNTDVITHSNLSEAIIELQKKQFDLIFIDVNILSVDENAVSKVIAKMSKAPVVSLTASSIKDIKFVKDGVNVVGHLKKPISKIELFKLSLKVLNSSESYSSLSSRKAQRKNEFVDLDKKNVEQFLLHHAKHVLPLFSKAVATNDLNTITTFTQTLLPLAQEYKINILVTFAKELLQKIELFDIETINSMMLTYKTTIKRLQNL